MVQILQTNNCDRASLMVQIVKKLHAMKETQVWSLGQEDPLEQGMTTYSSILEASTVLNSNKMKDKNHMIILIYAEKHLTNLNSYSWLKIQNNYRRNVP